MPGARLVATSGDDAAERSDGFVTTVDTTFVFSKTSTAWVGVQFALPLRADAKVADFRLAFTSVAPAAASGPCSVTIYVEDSANPAAFAHGSMGTLGGRSRATPSVVWNLPTVAADDAGRVGLPATTSPDLTPLVEHALSLAGWSYNSRISFLISISSTSCDPAASGARTLVARGSTNPSWYSHRAAPMAIFKHMCLSCEPSLTFPPPFPRPPFTSTTSTFRR
ncbi:uncharacterized protein AMSG_11704 [Thecamonas trahens ATCC 50062]|uniref:Uncharacterized protein n=1 Tax=Thecamonas trahens ATCC 50062 TaxID=461836 RepID=A0A0L0DXV2_THETB|nr:hypothetical protein AMSG_11704 [Thecamonas trahens ATCC 50062]KNC56358.1 hypothetical protein AMSG_11704 [Thecamonas trahens ATCC 50062]|eukprot:XP_013760997.1 hypothetical protein AMSG_11704 [Thecamonas trahens ATCC 50062]